MAVKHPTLLADLVDEWLGVRTLQSQLAAVLNDVYSADFIPPLEFYNRSYALLLPLGFSVLEHALSGLRDEDAFECRSSSLKFMMNASRESLQWHNFERVDRFRQMRNALVHEQVIPTYSETFAALDALEEEWLAWSILKGRTRYNTAVALSGQDLYENTINEIRAKSANEKEPGGGSCGRWIGSAG